MNTRRIFLVFVALFFLSHVSAQHRYRDTWQKPDEIMDAIGVKPGMSIGEAGAGEGYFTFKLSERVGPQGHIYANDINQEVLKTIEDKCRDQKITNISTILGKVKDPLFPDSLDMAVMLYVFHDLDKPVDFLNNIKPSLKPGARVIIIDRDPEKYGFNTHHFYTKDKIITLVSETDFKLEKVETFLPRDNIYILSL